MNKKSGINLLNDYKAILLALSTGKRTAADPKEPGKTIEIQVHDDPLISAIYADAQTRLREPRHLEQVIKALDQIDWFVPNETGWVIFTKACWKKTLLKPNQVPASTLPPEL